MSDSNTTSGFVSDTSADALNKAEVANLAQTAQTAQTTADQAQSTAQTAQATATQAASAGDTLMAKFDAIFDKVEDMASRLATIEESVSPILHLIPGVATIAPMADELASIVENLSRGRVRT